MASTKNEITLASNGKTYEAKPAPGCMHCAFTDDWSLCQEAHQQSPCGSGQRTDGRRIIWNEVEKC